MVTFPPRPRALQFLDEGDGDGGGEGGGEGGGRLGRFEGGEVVEGFIY